MRFFNLAWLAISSTIFLAACGDDGTSAQSETMTDDRDGQTYRVVTIGSQTWMAENLNFMSDSSYCESKCLEYGRLYTWGSARRACPKGWHLPSSDEWGALLYNVGGPISDGSGIFSVGKVLRSESDWNDGCGTDAFVFSVLPAGYRVDGDYYGEGDYTCFWSSTPSLDESAYGLSIVDQYSPLYNQRSSNDDAFLGAGHMRSHGCSVRCLQDKAPGEKAKSSSSVVPVSSSSVVKSSSSFYQFNPNIEYGELTDTRDGQTYKTVIIGTQTWMAQNLNFKTDSSFCYNDEESNCTKYGRLYRWAAAIGKSEGECGFGYTCSLPLGNIQGVCPSGWHLPDSTEWKTLFAAVGGQWEGEGGVLMSTSAWNDYVDESARATDDFGFSALPAGSRGGSDGIYENDGVFTTFWSSSIVFEGSVEDGSFVENPYFVRCSVLQPGAMTLAQGMKRTGFSVRCLKD